MLACRTEETATKKEAAQYVKLGVKRMEEERENQEQIAKRQPLFSSGASTSKSDSSQKGISRSAGTQATVLNPRWAAQGKYQNNST